MMVKRRARTTRVYSLRVSLEDGRKWDQECGIVFDGGQRVWEVFPGLKLYEGIRYCVALLAVELIRSICAVIVTVSSFDWDGLMSHANRVDHSLVNYDLCHPGSSQPHSVYDTISVT